LKKKKKEYFLNGQPVLHNRCGMKLNLREWFGIQKIEKREK
jgi:hypothetical protein